MAQIARAMAVIGAVAASLMMLTISLDVLGRVVAGGSVPGLVELSETLLIVLVFFGLGYAEQKRTHVRVTLVTRLLSARVTRALRLVAYLLMASWLVMVTWSSGLRAVESYERGEFRFGLVQWPLWPARAAITLGLACMLGVVLVRLLKVHGGSLDAEPEEPDAFAGKVEGRTRDAERGAD